MISVTWQCHLFTNKYLPKAIPEPENRLMNATILWLHCDLHQVKFNRKRKTRRPLYREKPEIFTINSPVWPTEMSRGAGAYSFLASAAETRALLNSGCRNQQDLSNTKSSFGKTAFT
jgi:hypothetical protein